MEDLQKLASKLPWTNALKVWKLNTSLKKKRGPHRRPQGPKGKGLRGRNFRDRGKANKDDVETDTMETVTAEIEKLQLEPQAPTTGQGVGEAGSPDLENSPLGEQQEVEGQEPVPKVLKFRVTCSRAGDKHSFSSNEAARDFGGAVQDFFLWKADMTKFDIEVKIT